MIDDKQLREIESNINMVRQLTNKNLIDEGKNDD